MTTTQRSLETALKSSMDAHTLSNLVSSLRVPVKKAKVCAIHKVTTQIKRMRGKKGSEEQKKANTRKADRLMEELQFIKKLNADKIAKFSLGNILTLENVTTQFKGDMEMKALVRLSLEKPLQDRISKWRSEHADWRSLASYIVQHTGRKYKPKDTTSSRDIENKPKFKHQQRETGHTSAHTPMTEEQDSSYHSDSTGSNDAMHESQSDDDSDADSIDIQSKREALLGPDTVTLNTQITNEKNENQSVGFTDSSVIHDKQTKIMTTRRTSNSNSNSDNESGNENLSSESEDEHFDASDSNDSEHKLLSSNIIKSADKKDNKAKNKKENLSTDFKVKSKKKTKVLNSGVLEEGGEMVVRKLDLQALEGDADADISFIFTGRDKAAADKPEKGKRKKHKSDFFLTGAGDSDASHSSGGESDEAEGDSDEEQMIGDARRAMHESTFLGSLAGPAKKFKDFAAIRKEKRGNKKEGAGFQKQSKQGTGFLKQKNTAKSYTDKKDPKKSVVDKPVAAKSTTSTDEKLHPSWEASKKRKLQQSAIPAFAGKKFTFDD